MSNIVNVLSTGALRLKYLAASPTSSIRLCFRSLSSYIISYITWKSPPPPAFMRITFTDKNPSVDVWAWNCKGTSSYCNVNSPTRKAYNLSNYAMVLQTPPAMTFVKTKLKCFKSFFPQNRNRPFNHQSSWWFLCFWHLTSAVSPITLQMEHLVVLPKWNCGTIWYLCKEQ